MKILLKVLIPTLVLLGSAFAAKTILENRPEPAKRPQFPQVQAVDAITLKKTNYPVVINSQGTVQPTLSSTLVPEVNGSVTAISPNFVLGGNFSEGEVLVQIDDRDYQIALTQAKANLAQSNAQLQEEAARGKLAKAEWESLGRGQKASAFTLRQPQLAAARANRDAARAQIQRAELDLERTKIIAPFDGSVLEKSVDQGQFVSRGGRLGTIYSAASVDVRLPLSNRQLTYLDVPASDNIPLSKLPNVELLSVANESEQIWTGKLIRAEGVDTSTQQLNVIARIENPLESSGAPLRVGQYVEAKIAGNLLENVFVLPRAAVREDREVLVLDENQQIQRRDVTVAWADEETVAIVDGLDDGMILVTTPLSTVANGTPVSATIDGVAPAPREGRRGGGKNGGWNGEAGQGRGQGGEAGQGRGQGGEAGQGQRRGQNGEAGQGQRRAQGGEAEQGQRSQGN